LENPIRGVRSNPILPTTLDDPTLVEVQAANLVWLGLELNLVEVRRFPIGTLTLDGGANRDANRRRQCDAKSS
jgi:hypothetical protein